MTKRDEVTRVDDRYIPIKKKTKLKPQLELTAHEMR